MCCVHVMCIRVVHGALHHALPEVMCTLTLDCQCIDEHVVLVRELISKGTTASQAQDHRTAAYCITQAIDTLIDMV